MTANGAFQLAIYVVVLLALAKPLGAYMARVYEGRPVGVDRALGWLERLVYRLGGVRADQEMGWKTYAATMLLFNVAGLLAVYVLQRVQGVLPLNPQGLSAVSPDSSFNTAVSFATNTNWQGYGGESTMSYLTQMLGADRAELRLGGDRHGGAGGADPGLRPAVGRDHRQLLGRPHADHALHPAPAVLRPGAGPGVAGHGPDLRPLCQGLRGAAHRLRGAGDRQGRQARSRREGPAQDQEVDADRAGHRGGAGGLADRHQAARHQRRRLLQRQLGASASRTRRRCRTSSRCWPSCSSPPRSATRSASW